MSDQPGTEPSRFPTRIDLSQGLGITGLEDVVEIGRGGFSVVFKARQPVFGRDVAVKVITTLIDQRSLDRFDRERRTIGALTGHPNIVTVFSSGETSHGLPYIEMEFMAGGSLADHLPAEPIDWRRATELMIKITRAVEAAHAIGVLHRDIKPENILLSSQGEPKLGDFGIARLEGLGNTSTGVVTASIAHAAPEIVEGRTPTIQADIYALASTLYTLIDGWPAHVRETDESVIPVLARVATEPVPDLRVKGVPDALCLVLEQAMAKDPTHRPATAAALADALEAAIAAPATPAPVTPAPWTPTMPVAPPADARSPHTPVDSPVTHALGAPNPRPYDAPVAAASAPVPAPAGGSPWPRQSSVPGSQVGPSGPPTPQHVEASSRRAWYVASAVVAVVAVLIVVGVIVGVQRGSSSASTSNSSTGVSSAPTTGDASGGPASTTTVRQSTTVSTAPASTPKTEELKQSSLPLGAPPRMLRPPGTTKYVVATDNGLFTSNDGSTFTPQLPGETLWSVAAGSQGWVAAGSSGIFVSSDAGSWTKVADGTYTGVGTDGRRWVAVGLSGRIAVSDDGTTFKEGGVGLTNFRGVATNGVGWVAVGDGGAAFTSEDGVSWSIGSAEVVTEDLIAIGTDGNRWVAVGRTGAVIVSNNASKWHPAQAPTGHQFGTVAGSDGALLIGGGILASSATGLAFSEQPAPTNDPIKGLARDGESFALLDSEGVITKVAPDGKRLSTIGTANSRPASTLALAVAA